MKKIIRASRKATVALGRLAACFLDSLADVELQAQLQHHYDYGIFQANALTSMKESHEYWLEHNP